MKKVMHNTDTQYIKSEIHHKFTSNMHNLKTNFDKFFDITKLVFKDRLNKSDNFYLYLNEPKLSDCEIIALSVTGESIGIDSENYFWGKLKSDHKADSPRLIDRSNFNRRRKHLYPFIKQLNQRLADRLNESEDVYLVDSIPVPVCQIAREKQSKIFKESFETAPDKGYLSSTYQLDLFNSCQVNLQTPKRANQERQSYPAIFKRMRKRIETLFAQLCDQFMLRRNYAKTTLGLSVRILLKITAVILLQYINSKNNKPINHLKYALAS
jgi:hypothetical protein